MTYENFVKNVQSGLDEKIWAEVRNVLRLSEEIKSPDLLLFESRAEYQEFSQKIIEDLKNISPKIEVKNLCYPNTPITRIIYSLDHDEIIVGPFIAFDPEGFNDGLKYFEGIDPELMGIIMLSHEESEVGVLRRNRNGWIQPYRWPYPQNPEMKRRDILIGEGVLKGIVHNYVFDCQRYVLNRLGYNGRKIVQLLIQNQLKVMKKDRRADPSDIVLLINDDYFTQKKGR